MSIEGDAGGTSTTGAASAQLPATMLIRTACAAQELLAPLFDAPGGDVVLDGGEVVELDAAGLQVLLSCEKTARAAGVKLTIAPCSPALSRVLERTGVARRFGLPPGGATP